MEYYLLFPEWINLERHDLNWVCSTTTTKSFLWMDWEFPLLLSGRQMRAEQNWLKLYKVSQGIMHINEFMHARVLTGMISRTGRCFSVLKLSHPSTSRPGALLGHTCTHIKAESDQLTGANCTKFKISHHSKNITNLTSLTNLVNSQIEQVS